MQILSENNIEYFYEATKNTDSLKSLQIICRLYYLYCAKNILADFEGYDYYDDSDCNFVDNNEEYYSTIQEVIEGVR